MDVVWYIHHFGQLNRFNTLRPRQNSHHFADDIFKCIFLNENASISIKISLKFDPKGPNNNIPELVQIMAWRRPGDKPLSEPMMVSFPTHICVTRPQLFLQVQPYMLFFSNVYHYYEWNCVFILDLCVAWIGTKLPIQGKKSWFLTIIAQTQ